MDTFPHRLLFSLKFSRVISLRDLSATGELHRQEFRKLTTSPTSSLLRNIQGDS